MKELKDYNLNEIVEYETGNAVFKIAKGVALKEILYSMAHTALQWKMAKDGGKTATADIEQKYAELCKHHNQRCTCSAIF